MNIPDGVVSIVCDDIRIEDNGKAIIIGVYVGDILVSEFPASLRLGFWVQWKNDAEIVGKTDFEMQIEVEGHEEKIRSQGSFNGPLIAGADIFITAVGAPVTFRKPTSLKVSAKFDSGPWKELANKRVDLRPTLASPSTGP